MLFRPTNPLSHRLARIAFILAIVAALSVASAGPLLRYAGIEVDAAINLFLYGFYLGAAGIALGLATIVPTRPGDRRRGFLAALLAIVIGLGAVAAPFHWLLSGRRGSAINDVSTDTADPPAMVVTLQMRRDAKTPATYPKELAAQQREAYPDIRTITLKVPPAEAFKRVDRVAMALGWDVVARAPSDGKGDARLEAIATSPWFGLRDDIVVRIRPDGTGGSVGSKIDIRAKSRVGHADPGVNARHIREFTEKLNVENQ